MGTSLLPRAGRRCKTLREDGNRENEGGGLTTSADEIANVQNQSHLN